MESSGKWRMFMKLLLSVVCLFSFFCSSSSSHVVNFNQVDRQLDFSKRLEVSSHVRRRRDSETDSEKVDAACQTQKDKFLQDITKDGKRLETAHTFINETKFSLALAWAGTDDDGVLIAMTSAMTIIPNFKFESTLWRSKDSGRTWSDDSAKVGAQSPNGNGFRKDDGLQRNPHHPKYVYLVSYDKFLFKTEDGGDSWKRVDLPGVVRDELIFHQDESYKDYILVITSNNQLVMTTDNFNSFHVVAEKDSHKAHWGTVAAKSPTTIFAAFGEEVDDFFPFILSDMGASLFELQRRPADGDNWKTVRKNVADFGIQGDFLYASVYKDANPKTESERLLIVSNDNGDNWNEAQIPTINNDRFFSVLDMSEHLIFIHVDNPGDTGHGTLYTSWSRGIFFSESLERHLYPNFNSITDFYKVQSMMGTYIASQLHEDNSIHSLITFDLGGEWQPLTKPDNVPCKDDVKTCSLQIHNSYSLHRGVKAYPPVSTEDAKGLIIVNAHAAENLQTTDPDVYISSDGGYSWRKALDGPHSYVIADSGGLIVAVSMQTATPNELKFSTDEGRCWHTYKFTNETIQHTGLLTEPGGKSLTVAIWGYTLDTKKWAVHVIDFGDVIQRHCDSHDYEMWIPHESMKKGDSNSLGCLLGKKVTFQRLKADSWCHNGYYYDPDESKNEKPCICTKEDFECDYGYYRPNEQENCVEDPNFRGHEIDVCDRGHVEKVISEGYRKIPGDVCDESSGFSPHSKFINLTERCSDRFKPPPPFMNVKPEGGTPNSVIVVFIIVVLIIVVTGLAYFGYKMVLLRRHKVVYRYSMLNQNADKDIDGEIERTLTGEREHPMFGETSDEEELPAHPPQMNGKVKKSKPKVPGFHDDSDDDMLS